MQRSRLPATLRWIAVALWGCLPLGVAAAASAEDAATPRRDLVFACEYDTRDTILGYICRRVGGDVVRLGAERGFDVEVREPNSVGDSVWAMGDGFVQLVLRIEANQPEGMFDKKTIVCTLAGTRVPTRLALNGEPDPADYQVSFQAEGVARDLVHPVADAVLELMDGYFTRVAATTP